MQGYEKQRTHHHWSGKSTMSWIFCLKFLERYEGPIRHVSRPHGMHRRRVAQASVRQKAFAHNRLDPIHSDKEMASRSSTSLEVEMNFVTFFLIRDQAMRKVKLAFLHTEQSPLYVGSVESERAACASTLASWNVYQVRGVLPSMAASSIYTPFSWSPLRNWKTWSDKLSVTPITRF